MEYLNEIGTNNNGTPMKIIAFRKYTDLDVQFLDEHGYVKENVSYQNFKQGCVKNPYDKTICGIGWIGVGNYAVSHNCKHTDAYQCWHRMLDRCYSPQRQDKFPAYYNICEVDPVWYDYQIFAEWYEKNIYQVGTERMHLDKDILVKGNKLYSPETCLIVPQRINMLFLHKPNKYGLPNGIQPNESGTKYYSSYGIKNLGVFNSVEEAAIAHDVEKKKVITEVAEEYKPVIPNKLYEALINWKPDYEEGFVWAA